MSNTLKSGWRYPASSAAPNVPLDIQNLATDLDWLGANFPTVAARNAANPTPAVGDQCRVAGQPQQYIGTAWVNDTLDPPAWTTLPLSANWTGLAAGVPGLCYRRWGGMIWFSGAAFHTGAITVAGVVLSPANATIIAAVPANAGNSWSCPVAGEQSTNAVTTALSMLALADGRLFVQSSANTTGGGVGVSFNGAFLRDMSVG